MNPSVNTQVSSCIVLNRLIDTMTGNHTLTKVVYKPDTQSTEEYIVIVDEEEASYYIITLCQPAYMTATFTPSLYAYQTVQ